MPDLSFSRKAVSDLKSIDRYTAERWGLRQAERYLQQIEAFCKHLAKHPATGRVLTPKRSMLRAEHREHVIFYKRTPEGIFIYRILHSRMLPERQRIR